jgi:septum formation protein
VLVLASASPRRLELLRQAGFDPLVDAAAIDETPDPRELPEENAARLARDKALLVAARHPGDLVLGADTIVVVDGQLLGKPEDADDAEAMLRRLAGRMHHVVTCVHLAPAPGHAADAFAVRTTVTFRALE